MSGSEGGEPLLDSLTQIDELLEKTNELLGGLSGPIQRLNSSLGNQDKPVVQSLPRKKRTVDFTTNVVGGADVQETTKEMPFDGYVDGVIGGWPDGADLSVGAAVLLTETGEQLFPSGGDQFAAFNDFTNEFAVTFPIEKGQEVTAEFKNNKTQNVGINITLEAYKKLPFETMEEIRSRVE